MLYNNVTEHATQVIYIISTIEKLNEMIGVNTQ